MTTWSAQQEGIFNWFKTGKGNLVVRARAGTGKTTTILEAINYAPEKYIMLCAFNKRIADELTKKLRNPKAQAKTLHSIGFSIVRSNWQGVKVDDDRAFRIARKVWSEGKRNAGDRRSLNQLEDAAPSPVITAIVKLAGVGKNAAPFASIEDLENLALAHNIVPEGNGFSDEVSNLQLAQWAHQAMYYATEKDGTIDFDDMVYLPVYHEWMQPVYDLVVVDEAQDMNATQLALAQGVARGRVVVVGDDRQAIYGFRGADSNAIDRLLLELKAQELPLTTTYRCPKTVVAVAQKLVPDYTAADVAPDGQVIAGTEKLMFETAAPGDFILSRVNAPLARISMAFLREKKKVRIEGKDIGKGLLSLVKKMKAESIPDFVMKLEAWADKECTKLSASKKSAAMTRMEYIRDQEETLITLTDGCTEVEHLTSRIQELFESTGPAIVCSSVHKAKGLEADKVFVLVDTLYCGGKRHSIEEENIHYVAVTRAKCTLVLVKKEEV